MTVYTQTDLLTQQVTNAQLKVAVTNAQTALNTANAAKTAGDNQLRLITDTIAEQAAAAALAAAQNNS